MNRRLLLLIALGLALGAAPATAGLLYGVTGSGGAASSLYTIDPTTGASTLVGATGFNHVTSLRFNPVTGILYGISNVGVGTLISIDPSTGIGTAVATISPSQQWPDMAFSATGTLYSWSEASPDHLNSINLVTGAATDIGASGISTGRTGLAIDSTGAMYLKNFDGMWSINIATGAATFAFGFADPGFDNILAFDENDLAYTVDRTGGTSFLYTIDFDTQGVQLIGNTGLGTLAALAFAPSAIPEPSSLALLGFVGTSCAGVWWRRRKPPTTA